MARKTPAPKALAVVPEACVAMPDLPASVPAFASERLQLLAPLITARVWQLALYRFCGGRLVKGKGVIVPDGEAAVRTALVLAHSMWPHIAFKVEEEALMRGMDADTVNPQKKAGLIRPFA